MEKSIAKIISYLFHPLFMPTLGIFILFNSGSHITLLNIEAQKLIYIITFIFTCVAPLLFMPFFIYAKFVNSLKMETIKERIYPLLLTIIFYSSLFIFIKRQPVSGFIISFLLGSLVSVLVLFVITLKWKISAHMTGIGGLLGLIIALSVKLSVDLQIFLFAVFIIGGFLGYSRLKLNEHNSLQILCGFILGFLSVFLSMVFY